MINPLRPLLRQREQRPVTVDDLFRKLRWRLFRARVVIVLLGVLDRLCLVAMYGAFAFNVIMLTAKMIDHDPRWMAYALSIGLMLGISLSARDNRHMKRRSQQ